MADTMTPEQRSRCMSRVKCRDTKPELLVRRFLFSKGLRFRVNVSKLPGKPDIVLPKYRTVVFINGCFWHGHIGCRYATMPKTNREFWQTKIDRNRARDIEVEERLTATGWRVIRIWECQLKPKYREETLAAIYSQIVGYDVSDEPLIAAEPTVEYGITANSEH